MNDELTNKDSHFAFGKNWSEYAEKIGEVEIEEAMGGLSRLLGGERLDGRRFLDIGCGSGLHSLAALRLGAAEVVAVDIDSDSVTTTRAVLEHHFPEGNFTVERRSVFDLEPREMGRFEVVYSWGVLHHTGNLYRAVQCAASLVAESGIFAFALYRKTWMCWFWKAEKRWYAHTLPNLQSRARSLYIVAYKIGLLLTGRNFDAFVQEYHRNRGMNFYHDVHDWMGGWPYESISPEKVRQLMQRLNFSEMRSFVGHGQLWGRYSGFFGSGCDEYVYHLQSEN